jgi:hypothetical protein
MNTKSGYQTNGTYLKYKSGFTSNWIVEINNQGCIFLKTEQDADRFVTLHTTGSDLWSERDKEFMKECKDQLLPKWKK